MWRCNILDDLILCCDMVPAIRPLLANHLPIITILDLPFPRALFMPSLNFCMAKWSGINEELEYRLKTDSPVRHITSKEEFIQKVDNVVHITYEVLQELINEKLPNPYNQHWWTSVKVKSQVQSCKVFLKSSQSRLIV